MLDIKKLCKLYEDDKIFFTAHVLQRCKQRNIRPQDIRNCVNTGEIIEQYPDDFPDPSCLIFGYSLNDKILHVVVSCNGESAKIVTAYYPSNDKFENDMKTRKEKKE